MKSTVTMADVAREAGVSKSTVSLALKGSELLPASTRARVSAVAERLGYRRDPLLSALSARRRSSKATYHGAIALLPLAAEPTPSHIYLHSLWRAAKTAAATLGYSIEEYKLDYSLPDLSRLVRTWRARGVVGVVWGTRISPKWIEAFPWQHFSSVTVARSNAPYPLHVINSDLSDAMLQTWRRIAASNYKRVAVLIRRKLDESLGWRLSLLWKGVRTDDAGRFVDDAIRHYDGFPLGKELADWLAAERPDVLVVDNEACCRAVLPALPKECHLVAVGMRMDAKDFTGMYHPAKALAEVAMLKLDGMIRTGERGPAVNRQITLVAGQWVEGTSAPGLV